MLNLLLSIIATVFVAVAYFFGTEAVNALIISDYFTLSIFSVLSVLFLIPPYECIMTVKTRIKEK